MGKSPGKWIKSVLFRKKHSKCTSSNSAPIPDKLVPTEIPAEDNSPVISDPSQVVENGASINSSTIDRGSEVQHKFVSISLSDDKTRRQCEAATKAQAAFRGYLARRAFRALHGIIRLQALIRGRLVRRQAVATLNCMQAILKLQALSRGHVVDIGANSIFGSGKLATNVYVRKLHLSLPAADPPSLQYNTDESNSPWNWLKRWSSSHFWDQPTNARKVPYVKPRIKQIGSQNSEAEPGKSKRSSRRASMGDIGPLSSSGGKIETARFSADDLSSKGDEKDYHKEVDNGREIRKRRSISLNQPRLPSYMMVTESSKAKLRLSQVSSVELMNEDDGNARRHSIPASTNGKITSLLPMVQNRCMASSKDDKGFAPGWRR